MLTRHAVARFMKGYFSTCDRSPKTVAAYGCDLRQFVEFLDGDTEIEELTPDTVESWAQTLKDLDRAPATIRRKLATLRVFLNYWVRRGLIDRSPMWNLRLDLGKARVLTKTLSLQEVRDILVQAKQSLATKRKSEPGAINHHFLALRNLTIVELMFATGMRVGEVAATKMSHVFLDERTVTVQGKGRRERIALLTDAECLQTLADYMRLRERIKTSHAFFFINVSRNPLSTQGISNALRKLAIAAGVEKHVTPHMIRHTVATLLLANGADIRVVQEFLGHASITTTQRYTHVTKAHLAATLQEHHPRMELCL